ncbi:MAG: ATP synthase F1 subunit delta [Lachnospiraceae bacterium]|nr:ATP synthase F1 subunit delta [Lachnospiraceae bacterium]
MAKLVSKTYGEALFELAVEENKTGLYLEEVANLLKVIQENQDFGQFMNHPKIPKEEKLTVMENIFRDKMDKELLGFLVTIVEKDRYSEIEEILKYVIDSIKEYRNIGVAYVTTAIPLQENQKKDVENKLLSTTKYETLECHYKVDEGLIGGMVIRMGDRVVDSSIRTKLESLERELLAIQLS